MCSGATSREGSTRQFFFWLKAHARFSINSGEHRTSHIGPTAHLCFVGVDTKVIHAIFQKRQEESVRHTRTKDMRCQSGDSVIETVLAEGEKGVAVFVGE